MKIQYHSQTMSVYIRISNVQFLHPGSEKSFLWKIWLGITREVKQKMELDIEHFHEWTFRYRPNLKQIIEIDIKRSTYGFFNSQEENISSIQIDLSCVKENTVYYDRIPIIINNGAYPVMEFDIEIHLCTNGARPFSAPREEKNQSSHQTNSGFSGNDIPLFVDPGI